MRSASLPAQVHAFHIVRHHSGSIGIQRSAALRRPAAARNPNPLRIKTVVAQQFLAAANSSQRHNSDAFSNRLHGYVRIARVIHELFSTSADRTVHGPVGVEPRKVMQVGAAAGPALSKYLAGLAPAECLAAIFDHSRASRYVLGCKNSQPVDPRGRYSQFEVAKLRNPLLRELRHRLPGFCGQGQSKIRLL